MSTFRDVKWSDPPAEVVATSSLDRMHHRVEAVARLNTARQQTLWAADDLDKIGDTEQWQHTQAVLTSLDDALDSLSDVLGAKHE